MMVQRLAVSGCLVLATTAILSAGPFIPLGTQSLIHPLLPPSVCASCHADYDSQNHLEPWDTWAGSCDVEDDVTGEHLFHFVLNNCIALDNRIPPLGFEPKTELGDPDPETVPVNYEYPETVPGSGILVNWDITQYVIPVPPGAPLPVTIETTLEYQTASKEYVEFLQNKAVENNFPDDCLDRTDPLPPGMSRGEYLYSLWDDPDYGRSPPVDMGSANVEVSELGVIFADGFESGDTSAWDSTNP